MENSFLNELVKLSAPIIDDIIKSQLPDLGKYIDGVVTKLNKMASNEGPFDFDVDVYGNSVALNLTMTTAAEIQNNLVKINFDGTFHAPNGTVGPKNMIKKYAPRFEHSHSEQIFIHQSMVNSLLKTAESSFFPINL